MDWVKAAIERIETAAKANGVALGNVTRNWDQARELYKKGYQFLTLCSETTLLVQGAQDLLGRFKEEVRQS